LLGHNHYTDDIKTDCDRIEQLVVQEHQSYFGTTPQHLVRAPGRVNLIGEHTDYNGGFVFPCAIEHSTWATVGPNDDNAVHVRAIDFEEVDTFNLHEPITVSTTHPWSNYVRGVAKVMQDRGMTLHGCDLVISGNVPKGAGLSSSASLEVAVAAGFAAHSDLSLTLLDLAKIGQEAENDFVGCSCGIMDQLVSATGKQGQAVMIDCSSLDVTHVDLPASLDLLIIESGVQRGLVDSEYNLRRQQCESVAAYLDKPSLRDVTLSKLEDIKNLPNPIAWNRATHVIEENQRVIDFITALESHDVQSLGVLMKQSHASLRDLFEVTTPELDLLVELIEGTVGERGGARMTGGGFGGCVVALVEKSLTEKVVAHIEAEYFKRTGLTHTVIRAKPGAGLSIQSPPHTA